MKAKRTDKPADCGCVCIYTHWGDSLCMFEGFIHRISLLVLWCLRCLAFSNLQNHRRWYFWANEFKDISSLSCLRRSRRAETFNKDIARDLGCWWTRYHKGKYIYILPFLFSMSQTSTTINPTRLIKHLDGLFIRFSLAAKHLSNSTTSVFTADCLW